jgi:hypothetical protein
VQWYRATGAAFLTASPTAVAEAWWNDVKTVWRALIVNSIHFDFRTVFVREDIKVGEYGEYGIPVAEQKGTRPTGTLGDFLPPANAMGVRLTVGSGLTRPGQKRLPGIMEGDTTGRAFSAAFVTLAEDVAAKYSGNIILGAPVATGTLDPEIVRRNAATGAVETRQDITGFLINTVPTTQVSRREGNGS